MEGCFFTDAERMTIDEVVQQTGADRWRVEIAALRMRSHPELRGFDLLQWIRESLSDTMDEIRQA
ncbi:hypothetical protein AAC03nite_01410 [Alicyclobacillus acidoterrestris]|uniref:hypothetical protein n=1 Tax=Alicyclobacillus suci TaxID=2816080 RepID=UPI001192F489|nr:hypothetical protein [Alicyclobacillus suci]GEO24356.1 hypothetical protein AAC03nite_01410 [Alicyclobacillus acidoterrestris]